MQTLWNQRKTAGVQFWTLRPASGPEAWSGPSLPPGSEVEALRSGPPESMGNVETKEGEDRNADYYSGNFLLYFLYSPYILRNTGVKEFLPCISSNLFLLRSNNYRFLMSMYVC